MHPYQEFIAKSRYARYLPQDNRREDWPETVRRWVDFMRDHAEKFSNGRLDKFDPLWNGTVFKAIRDLDVLPSMRSIMTAGPALERTNVAAYNCAYLPVDNQLAFDEAMYILLCGTGVGFSVESQYTSQLPTIPSELILNNGATIVVEDSKEGWCYAFRELIAALYRGRIPDWDTSKVRPAGAPLKTFGGRASGPGPLVDLFKFTINKFQAAAGRRLSNLDCHDIMCKIGEVVVVGGVRRSAMISLGDLHDEQHRLAKHGAWWELESQRALSNNSAVYESRPSRDVFDAEWADLIASGSGERGIFNREASKKQAASRNRRPYGIDYGTNPCSEIILRPYQFCNLSTVVVKPTDGERDLERKVVLAAFLGTLQASLTDFPYLRPIWKENTEAEALLGVSMTGILDNPLLNGMKDSHRLPALLNELRRNAQETNIYWAKIIGVKPAAAITCVKPEGTVSQLTMTASGIHPNHASHYIRRVRQDRKDPLTQFLINEGIPSEACVMKPDETVVFEFPLRGHGMLRKDLTAIEHLDIWLTYQRYWCEHKPSVTISVKPNEWESVGNWVYENFDECTGVSFLPDDGGTYRQAPYEECSEEEYVKREAALPKVLYWDTLQEYSDNVEGAQMLACTAGGCSI